MSKNQPPCVSQQGSCIKWLSVYNNDVNNLSQSTTTDVSVYKSSNEKSQNVLFSDQHDEYTYDLKSYIDPVRYTGDSDDASHANFFSRPIKIHEEEWGTGTVLYFSIDPWSLFCENPRVINRLTNFNLMRATLKVKLTINGNGFLYGRAIASYLPLAALDNMSTNAGLVHEDIVQASQLPHVFLDPCNSTGGTMTMPFFYPENYICIPFSDWDRMGTLTVRSINSLKHANGADDQCTISVFAWLEDVHLSVPTSREPGTLIPQMGEIDTANKAGIVSGPASVVAKVAGALSNIPTIRPFALATEMMAEGIGRAAKSLGYCRPTMTQTPHGYKPQPISSLSMCTVPDNIQKLSVDDKQELTIDPRISGLDSADPLGIVEIAKRESYLTSFTWSIGTAPETLLWNARVDPVTWAESGSNSFHFPACAMAALPFKYWNGTMKFRFQIVASSFHKGRLKVMYDPHFFASNEYNINHLKVVDIANELDFTISIGNGQTNNILQHHRPGVDSVTQMYSTTTYASKEEGNGVIGVYVVNELTTPNSTVNNDIEVNVYVSMGDDFEVFVPDDFINFFALYGQSGEWEPQMGQITPESEDTSEPDAPQQTQAHTLGLASTDDPLLNKIYMGESIKSFRTILKRYNFHSIMFRGGNGTASIQTATRGVMPYLRGEVPGAVDTSATGSVNYCNTLLLHWVRFAFSGWRGAIRNKLLIRQTGEKPIVLSVERDNIRSNHYSQASLALPSANLNDTREFCAYDGTYPYSLPSILGNNGMGYTISTVNPVLDFEMPFYNVARFVPGKDNNLTSGTEYTDGFLARFTKEADSIDTLVEWYVAAGEDFQCYFWTGLPRCSYIPTLPTT